MTNTRSLQFGDVVTARFPQQNPQGCIYDYVQVTSVRIPIQSPFSASPIK